MHREMNRKTARDIAQNRSLHKEEQDFLEECIFTSLQIAERRGEVVGNMTNDTKQVVRLVLLQIGVALTFVGWLLDWRGYLQGVGGGMCVVLMFWSGLDVLSNAKKEANENT